MGIFGFVCGFVKPIAAKKKWKNGKNTLTVLVWKSINDEAAQNNSLKTLHPKSKHCCEAPQSILSNYFCTKQVLRGTFWEILCI